MNINIASLFFFLFSINNICHSISLSTGQPLRFYSPESTIVSKVISYIAKQRNETIPQAGIAQGQVKDVKSNYQQSAPQVVLGKTGPDTKQFKKAYTIFHPLTFPQSRKGKSLNLTLQSEAARDENVQARVMNQPDLYPDLKFVSAFPNHNKITLASEKAPLERYDDSRSPQPPTSSKYIVNSPQLTKVEYNDEYVNTYSRKQEYNKSEVQHYNSRLEYGDSFTKRRVPKQLITPLQMYNKIIVSPASPQLLPEELQQQQQWMSCMCVPFYLCKNGILNSGGRLQSRQKRTLGPAKQYLRNGTKRSNYVLSTIVNTYPSRGVSSPGICDDDKVCCQVNIDNNYDADDRNYYPIATPVPDVPLSIPGKRYNKCGTRSAYGIQGRLEKLHYTLDVSEFGEYPWQVAILKKVQNGKNLYLCGGVLISPQWIATVAHCVIKEIPPTLLIRLGEWDVNRKDEAYPYVEIEAESITLHPDFHPESLANDIALIRMQHEVDDRSPHVTPVCLPFAGQVYDDQRCWVSGWGKDFFGPQGEYQNVLKEVDVPVVNRALCNSELRSTDLGPHFDLHAGFLCAGGESGKDACTGDGGSPLVCKSNRLWYVVGLVSWGIGCGRPGIPGVYVNLLYYVDWINSITAR